MSSLFPGSARLIGASGILSLLALAACGTDTALTSPLDVAALAAKGGGGDPAVRAADPDSGFLGTTIDVRVLGSGFDNGSRATWAVDGDTSFATTKVRTNSTRFIKSGELVANITIAADAPLTLFDIVVVTMAGKNGIGIEKFAVKSTGSTDAYTAAFDVALSYQLRSDGGGTYPDGGPNYSPNCVSSLRHGGGLYQLRTIANTLACKAVQRPAWRWFKVDLGASGLDLDQDGVAEAIEDAPGRLLADNAFAQGATSTVVKILLFVVNADGSTTQDQKYELRYRSGVSVTDIGSESRILEAPVGNAIVDIYNKWKAGNPVGPPIATVQLPFKLTLNPM